MSKSKKRMLRRLSLVTAVAALGVVAIVQSQRLAKSNSEEDPTSPSKAEKQEDQESLKPKEHPIVVRGNNDNEEQETFSGGGGFVPLPAPQVHSSPIDSGVSNAPPDFAPPPAAPVIRQDAVGSGADNDYESGGEFAAPPTLAVPSSIDTRQTDAADQFQPPAAPRTPTALAPSVLQGANDREPVDNEYVPSKSDESYGNNIPPGAVDRGTPNYADERNSFDASDRGAPISQDSYSQESYNSSDTYGANQYSSPRSNAGSSDSRFNSVAETDTAERASSTPGPKHLEGLQTPSIALQKQAPPEIQVGKPATFIVKVQNVGQVIAEEVTVFDRVPQGTRFLDASPQAKRSNDDSLMWRLGTMKPGEEKTISIELQPQVEGEIGSVARVSFESQASVRTVCTRPQLELQLTAPPKVLIGQNVSVGIRISNPGTGAAESVILEENVPEQFSHPAGGELEFEIGTLRPGESRTATLTLRAEKAGIVNNLVEVRGAGDLVKQEKVTIEVVAPDLDVAISGPTKRFLERRADYSLALANPGTAPARNVEMVAFLHKGMKFIEANNQGHYDQQNHAVYWSLEELPAGEHGKVTLSVLPVETGKQRLRVESRADLGIQKSDDHEVSVDGLASLFFEVVDSADPIEIGSDTVYRVRIINQGSKAATNVKLFAALPGGLKPIGADGPSGHQINGQSVLFDAIARLEPKAEVLFKIQARGTQAGRHQIRIQMVSDSPNNTGQTDPVSKEESTLVYSDR